MAATSGPAPWSDRWRSANKKVRGNAGISWDRAGYGYTDDWDKQPKKGKTKKFTLRDGRTVDVPDADYESFIGFQRMPDEAEQLAGNGGMGDYIDNANFTKEFSGAGHITTVKYAPRRQLLEAIFYDGADVVYFLVPKEVYSELEFLASGGGGRVDARGVFRHNLGIRFWDLIRIRGQKTGGRYKYVYWSAGKPTERTFDINADGDVEARYGTPGDEAFTQKREARKQDLAEWRKQEAERKETAQKNTAQRAENRQAARDTKNRHAEDDAIAKLKGMYSRTNNRSALDKLKAMSRDEQVAEAKKRGLL